MKSCSVVRHIFVPYGCIIGARLDDPIFCGGTQAILKAEVERRIIFPKLRYFRSVCVVLSLYHGFGGHPSLRSDGAVSFVAMLRIFLCVYMCMSPPRPDSNLLSSWS